ncbi:MAG: TniQ family protein [Methylophaga sp.]|nr:TniQ family protein [Methylophaga sp.]
MHSDSSPENASKYAEFIRNKPAELIDKAIMEFGKWLEYDKKHPVDTRERLLVVPPFDPRESLLGYLLRLGEHNHYDTNGVIVSAIIHDSTDWNKLHEKLATGKFDIPVLARLLGKGTADVYNMTYTLIKETTTKEPGSIIMDYFEYPLMLTRLTKPRVCVDCLKEGKSAPHKYPYHKRIWDIAHYTVCTKHYTLLNDICPSCKSQLRWARQKLTECQCGYDLCEISPVKVPLEHTLLSARVALSLDDEEQPDQHQINALEKGFFTKLVQKNSPDLPIPDGYSDYPHEITNEILARENQQYAYKRKQTRFSYKEMPNELLHRHFAFLYPDLFGNSEVNLSSDNHKVTTNIEAAAIIGMSITVFDKFKKAFPPADAEYYDKHELVYLSELYRNLLPTTKTCALLGISEHMLGNLRQNESLVPLFGPEINGYGDYLYHNEDVQHLIDGLKRKTVGIIGDEKLITIGEYTDIAVRHRFPFSDIVAKILTGKLPLYDFDPKKGLRSLTVNRDDLKDMNAVHHVSDELLDIAQVAEALSIYKDAVFRTIAVGLLKTVELRINKTVKSYINQDELEQFQTSFIFVNEIAKQYQCNPTNLSDKIIDEGVRPISGPGIDNNLVFIFKREDVEALDMASVIHKTGYKTKTGRPKKGTPSKWDNHPPLHDAGAIAEFLGTTIQKVSRLAKHGFLEPYDHKGILGNKRFFGVSQFKAYLNKYRDNPELITFEEALSVIGETAAQFKANWVLSKRIAFIEDGLEGRYLDRRQLDELRKFKKHAISTRDAAAQMGVDRSVIQNKHKFGYLKPISGPGIDEFGNYFYSKQDVEKVFPGFRPCT